MGDWKQEVLQRAADAGVAQWALVIWALGRQWRSPSPPPQPLTPGGCPTRPSRHAWGRGIGWHWPRRTDNKNHIGRLQARYQRISIPNYNSAVVRIGELRRLQSHTNHGCATAHRYVCVIAPRHIQGKSGGRRARAPSLPMITREKAGELTSDFQRTGYTSVI